MSLKEKILSALATDGTLTDEDFELRFKAPRASVRRSRGELIKEGKIARTQKVRGLWAWGLSQGRPSVRTIPDTF